MIDLHSKNLLIKHLEEGYSIVDACKLSGISKASLYRLFKEQPGLKIDVENATKKGTQKLVVHVQKMEEKSMEEIRKIINRRK